VVLLLLLIVVVVVVVVVVFVFDPGWKSLDFKHWKMASSWSEHKSGSDHRLWNCRASAAWL